MFQSLGIRAEYAECSLSTPALLVANHVSWLDILLIGGRWPVTFLANNKIRSWPVIGWLVSRSRSLFIKQGSGAKQANQAMRELLVNNQVMALFPEGRTNQIGQMKRFQPRLFQAAIDADAAVQPLAISYLNPDGTPATHVSFADDVSLVKSFWLIITRSQIVARLELMAALPQHPSRQYLAAEAETCIRSALDIAYEGTL